MLQSATWMLVIPRIDQAGSRMKRLKTTTTPRPAPGAAARAMLAVAFGTVPIWACSRTGLSIDEAVGGIGGNPTIMSHTSTCRSCRDAGADCGTMDDGCGHQLVCGDCVLPQSCGASGTPNRCGCESKTCMELGAECGEVFDGCDGTAICGTCPPNQICGGAGPNRCGSNPCEPTSCSLLGIACGPMSDGCGSVLNCGSCVAPNSCGGGGTAHACGCQPKTCGGLGATCGRVSDGCGGTLDCGGCIAPEICGVGGVNKCGCVPATCSSLNAYCGTILDGCGGELSCGVCQPDGPHGNHNGVKVCIGVGPSNCSEEAMPCTPVDCSRWGAECGSVSNGCGGVLDCGTCTAPAVCGGAGVPNRCGCVSVTCDQRGANCGTLSNDCGATLDCGNCPPEQICDSATNRCSVVIGTLP